MTAWQDVEQAEPEFAQRVTATGQVVRPGNAAEFAAEIDEASTGKSYQMPILHLSQLIGVAAGLDESELKFKRHVVPVGGVLEKLEAP